ncbi:hypothetical protein ACFL4T_00475 [candidate division KSB1 bacterium]
MKKTAIFIILVSTLIFAFCKKDSTSSEPEEDIIKVEVLVRENGVPAQNIFVIIDATVTEPVRVRAVGMIAYEISQTDQETTNSYGKANFTYEDQSIPEIDAIRVEKVTIKKLNTVMAEDSVQKVVEIGETLKLEYDF